MVEGGRRRYAAVVGYDGTEFFGFQRQARERTVQAVLEEALKLLLGHETRVAGAGRTDSGVHARGQVISFVTDKAIPPRGMPGALARYLPRDVVVSSAFWVPEDFDPQRDAVSKTYVYRVWAGGSPDPLWQRYAAWHRGQLDIDLMGKAASEFVGRHDFASFRALGSSARTTEREVFRSEVTVQPDGLISFTVEADGFLYRMVRLMAGTLVDVGRGHLPPGAVGELVRIPGQGVRGQCLPGHGLCLEKVWFGRDLHLLDQEVGRG